MAEEMTADLGDTTMEDTGEENDEEGTQEVEDEVQEEEKEVKKKPKGKRAGRTILSGRGVTLKMLVDDGILDVEEGCMSIDYLGQKFVADLLPTGKIKWEGCNKLFNSPSAWAIHCKKLVNPSKKSGCGWASVKYKGKKLDQFKTTWFRKQRPLFNDLSKTESPSSLSIEKKDTTAVAPPGKNETATRITSPPAASADHTPPPAPETNQRKSTKNTGTPASTFTKIANQPSAKKELTQKLKNKLQRQSRKERSQESQRKSSTAVPPSKCKEGNSHEAQPQTSQASASSFHSSKKTKLVSSPRTSVNVSELRQDSDPKTLVECMNFVNLKKTQPFTVSINTNTLMLMDLHCHLTTSEVIGYLAGRWHEDTHQVQILQAFPVKCRFADKKNADSVEEEIRLAMKARDLVVVGWYHSHPTYQSDPSVRDIATQQHYQKCLKVEKFESEPCVGFIISPYDPRHSSRDSVIKAYWIESVDGSGNTQSSGYPLPMAINYSIQQSGLLTDDLLTEMRQICSYYKGSPDAVNVLEVWLSGVTFLDKIKASLVKTFPKDQSNRLNCFINMLLS